MYEGLITVTGGGVLEDAYVHFMSALRFKLQQKKVTIKNPGHFLNKSHQG